MLHHVKGGGGGEGGGGGARPVTRSDGKIYDFDTEFPPVKYFTPSDKLPDFKNVVGMMRHLLENGGRGVTSDMASREVAKQILAKWFHDTVYHKSLDSIQKMVKNLHTQYMTGKRNQSMGRLESEGYRLFIDLFEKKYRLFDVYPDPKYP